MSRIAGVGSDCASRAGSTTGSAGSVAQGLRQRMGAGMFNDGHEQQAKCPSQGLLRPGRFLWARAVPWGIVFGIVLWIAYKFVKGVGIYSGLDGSSGVPTVLGVLAALALYVLSVRLIERRTPDELGLAQLAPVVALLIASISAASIPHTPAISIAASLVVMALRRSVYQGSKSARSAFDFPWPCGPSRTGMVSTLQPGVRIRAAPEIKNRGPMARVYGLSSAPK